MVTPVAMPDFTTASAVFRPVRSQSIARSEGRETATVEGYSRYWIATYNIVPVSNAEAWRLVRFLSSREPFVATHPLKCRPLAYPGGPLSGVRASGGGPFNGTATLTDLTNRAAPIITGLPADFEFTEGDPVEFRMSDTQRSYHEVKADTVASGSGIVTLPLDYPVPLEFSTASTVVLEKPGCVMKIISDTQTFTPAVSRGLSFQAEEVFLP